jgi:hypothetical protein
MSLFEDLSKSSDITKSKDAKNFVQRYLYHPECPYANKSTGNVLESRYVWWVNNPTDRIDKYDTIVHMDGNKRNCLIDNLKKVRNRSKYIHNVKCPYADDKGVVLEEFCVWWSHNPHDPIRSGDIIIHKNGDKCDNRIENLVKWKKGRKYNL